MSSSIPYIYVYRQCLVAVFQCAEIPEQLLVVLEVEAISEDDDVMGRESFAVVFVH